MESLELYRQNAKKTNDPIVQWEFTKYLIETAESIDIAAIADANNLQQQQMGMSPNASGAAGAAGSMPSQENAILMKDALLAEGVKWLKKLTNGTGVGRGGLPDAQFLLAECYGAGRWGVSIDHEKAFSLYVQASKQSHREATYRAAVCYEMGAGTKKDASRSVQFYRKAASLSEPSSMFRLAMILLEGSMGVSKNEREGITWLKRAAAVADAEHPEALHELAACFEKQDMPSIIADENYAWELYIKAAQLGYAPSQYKLGHCFEYGVLGRETDAKRSIAWYSKAAEQGEPEAELALSGWYLTGADSILPQSDTEAYAWARKAADQELAKAEYAIGYYSEGNKPPRSSFFVKPCEDNLIQQKKNQ